QVVIVPSGPGETMVDVILNPCQVALTPNTMHGLLCGKAVSNQASYQTGVTSLLGPVQRIEIAVSTIVVTHFVAVALHQLHPLIHNGGLDPTGVATKTVPKKCRNTEAAEPGQIFSVKASTARPQSEGFQCTFKHLIRGAGPSGITHRHFRDRTGRVPDRPKDNWSQLPTQPATDAEIHRRDRCHSLKRVIRKTIPLSARTLAQDITQNQRLITLAPLLPHIPQLHLHPVLITAQDQARQAIGNTRHAAQQTKFKGRRLVIIDDDLT